MIPDPTAQDRLARLVDLLTPAAALGVTCGECGVDSGPCRDTVQGGGLSRYTIARSEVHACRLPIARAELRAILIHLLPETR